MASERLALHEERKQIKDDLPNTKLKEGDQWFILDFKWWQLWKAHVNYDMTSENANEPRPGPINNFHLLEDPPASADVTVGKLRPGLVEEYDYVFISKAAWVKLQAWYGGINLGFSKFEALHLIGPKVWRWSRNHAQGGESGAEPEVPY